MKEFMSKLLSTFAIVGIFFYLGSILVKQEMLIRETNKEIKITQASIDEASMRMEELKQERNKIDTDEYKEEVAREKLGYCKPYEIIFVYDGI